ncbi:SBBP repeat-containing protein [Flavobacterium sp. RHBU_24]|uniref:Ig-like domain-containing protein n=1 Tax=Flavobacterium sp. RHBU_24 TaxID=3391185 RepID=UPI003984BC9B
MKRLLLFCCLLLSVITSAQELSKPSPASKTGSEKLVFMENKGQVADTKGNPRPDILFSAKSGGTQLWLAKTAIHYQFAHAEKGNEGKPKMSRKDFSVTKKNARLETHHFTVQLEGASENAQIVKEKQSEYVENFYLAHCPNGITDVKGYEKITYKNIYPNIDWVIYTKGGFMEYDFIIHPGGKPSDIKLKVKDADSVNIENGELVVKTKLGEVHEKRPVSYDENGSKIATRFVKSADGSLSFQANFPKDKPYRIDPQVVWATYYGGSGDEFSAFTNIDSSNNVYLSGYTTSTSGIASGGYDTTFSAVSDLYLVKFNASGARLWATYYGGTGEESIGECQIDGSGNIYLAGSTGSASGMASGGFQNTYGGDAYDALLVKFNSSGARIWATYYGGGYNDTGNDCVVDSSGNVYLAGYTLSPLNIASGGYQNTQGGEYDAYLVKFSSSGSRLWATYYGGDYSDSATCLAVDGLNNIYLGGFTNSTESISSPGSYLSTAPGTTDTPNAFLAKFDTSGSRLWGTYYGGTADDYALGCSTDGSGNVYLSGDTSSTTGIASGGFQSTVLGHDAFLAKFTTDGALSWGTYYGGSGYEESYANTVDISGNIYLSGVTGSTSGIASGGFQNTYGGGEYDAFIVKFNTSGGRLWGSYYGGSGLDWGQSCAVGNNDIVYLSGVTDSTTGIAQTGFQNTFAGGTYDAFLAKISASSCGLPQNPVGTGLSLTTATLSWAAPATSTPTGYQYAVTTSATPPASGTATSATSIASYTITAGLTYYLHVRTNCSGTYSEWVTSAPFTGIVAGDTCGNAINLATLTSPYTGTTVGAADDYFNPTCEIGSGAPELQFYIDVPAGATITIGQTSNNYDSVNYFGTGTCDASTTIDCFDDPDTQVVTWTNTTGTTQRANWIQDGYEAGDAGTFTLSWTLTLAPGSCGTPSTLNTSGITATAATMGWTAASTGPPTGYQVYVSASPTAPAAGMAIATSTTSTNFTTSTLTAATTYYYWVRAICGSSAGSWVAGASFTTLSTGCTTAIYGQYPTSTFSPLCTGSAEPIATDCWAGEYSLVTTQANTTYTYTSSTATDYITITNTAGTVVYAAGITPIVWNSAAYSGTVRFYTHSNAACGSAQIDRTRSVQCGGCNTPAPLASAQSFCNSATVANLTATGTGLKWYPALTGGIQLAGTAALANGNYYVSQTLNGCEGPRTAVAVSINVTPIPSAPDQVFCNSATVANLTATGTALKWYINPTGGTQLAGTTALTNGIYYVSQTLNSCESARNAISVTINVTAPPTASAQSFCNSATVANLTATGTSLKWYAALTGGAQLAGTTALATGTYYVSQTLNGCESTRTAVAVTITTTAAPTASAQSFCNSATVANLVATGTGLKWYANLSGGTQLAGNTALATGTYYVSQTLNSCESTRTAVAVTITTTAAPTAYAQTFCNSATVANLTATGTALKWYAALTGGSQLAGTTALATGTYYVSQTLNGCESTRTAVAVTVNVTTAPTASAQTFCNSATVANLVATGTALKWYATATGGSQLAGTTALATGTYYVSQTLNGCESTRTAVAVTITTTAAPTASAQSFCNSATVANLTATGTGLKWYAALTGGAQLAGTTALATGNYYVSQTLNGCESTRTAVAVTITTTAAPTASAQSFCNSATVADLTAAGTGLQWYAALTGGTALTASTTLATGTYYVSQTIAGCESTRTAVSVTINLTAAPTASAQTFCNSATVANLTAIGTALKWYATLTGGAQLAGTTALATGTYYVSQTLNGCESTRTAVAVTITTTAAPTASAQSFCNSATVANLTATGTSLKWYANLTGGTQLAGTTALSTGTYYVSQTLNGCESTRTAVAVTINVTTAPTASAQTFCNSGTVANLTATGTSLKWYAALTGGAQLAGTTALATGTYYVSQTLNGCESTRTAVAVTINVTAAPTASAQSFCNSATVANLTATGTSLKWYAALTGGSQLAGTTALANGTYYVSQTLNGCESTRTALAVTINVTTPPTASAQSFCNSATVANLIATGTSLQWYAAATGGTALTASTTIATGTYYVSQTISGCESTRTAVAVTVNVTTAPTASAQSFCNSATVANLVATGTSLKWYANLTGGTQLAGTTALATGTYYVSQTLNGCESTRTAVAVTINVTTAPTASAQTFCNSGTVANLTATGTSLKWYAVLTGGTQLAGTTALATGTYYVSQTLNGCESTRTAVAVTINVTAAPTASAQSLCNSATVANLTATGTSLKWYAALTGGTQLAGTTALATGTYYVSQTLNNCESTRTAVAIVVNVVSAPQGAAIQQIAAPATIEDIVVTGTDIHWYASAEDVAASNSLPEGTVLIAGTTYYATQTVDGCESGYLAVTISEILKVTDPVRDVTLSYFPNPVKDNLTIVSSAMIESVSVYTILGQKVIDQQWNSTEGVINMQEIQEGSYLVYVNAKGITKSFVVLKGK